MNKRAKDELQRNIFGQTRNVFFKICIKILLNLVLKPA